MIDRLSDSLEMCLNLKSEWGLSRKPSLQAKGRPPSTKTKEGGSREEDRTNYKKRKRGRGNGREIQTPRDTEREGDCTPRGREREEDQRPSKRTDRREEPEPELIIQTTSETETGASTPVSVKIKRLESKSKECEVREASRRTIQPTLRSFMDLKSGLEGSLKRTGSNPENQSQIGRDLWSGPRGTPGIVGEAWKGEKKESKRSEVEVPGVLGETGGESETSHERGSVSSHGRSDQSGDQVQRERGGLRGAQGERS